MNTDKRKQQLREAQRRHRENNPRVGWLRIWVPPHLIEKVKSLINTTKEN